jgi:glyoxylase-like metal-dependent hydrolase (beta-lactamase superfamily II)
MALSRTQRRILIGVFSVAAALAGAVAWITAGSVWRAPHRLYAPPAGPPLSSWEDTLGHATRVQLCTLETGRVSVARSTMLRRDHTDSDAATEHVPFPVYAHWVHHPSRGDLLVDAGLDASFAADSMGNFRPPARAVHRLMGASFALKPGEDLAAQLARRGATPSMVLLTHAHGDHTAGLLALGPGVRVLAGLGEREDLAAHIGYGHLRAGQAIEEIDWTRGAPLAPFDAVVDLFGDASVLALSTPGHSRGHTSFLVSTSAGPVLLAGDASHSAWAFEHDVGPVGPSADSERTGQRSLDALRAFVDAHPGVRVVFGHEAVEPLCDG